MTHVSETHTYVDLKFFSSVSEMTLRFDDKLDMLAARIPLQRQEPALVTHRQFVLITPTYGGGNGRGAVPKRSEEHTSELQSRGHLVCRLLLEKKKKTPQATT